MTVISSSLLSKGEVWYIEIQITDDFETYSLNHTSQNITIVNKAPEVISATITGNQYPGYFVEDENVSITIIITDVDSGDEENSYLEWYVDGVPQPQFNNMRSILSNNTQAGQTWTVNIIASDSFDNSTIIYPLSFIIESRPRIADFETDILQESDGMYVFSINVTDSHHDIFLVRYDLFLNGSNTATKGGFLELNGTGHWIFDFDLLDEANNDYFNTMAIITITAQSIIGIVKIQSFNFTMVDKVAPRVSTAVSSGVWFDPNKDVNPTNLTFFADIEEYGSGIGNVTLHYYFRNASEGSGSTANQDYTSVLMSYNQTNNGIFRYTVTIPFPQDGVDYEVIYWVSTSDTEGNVEENAFDIRNYPDRINIEKIIFTAPGIPEEVLLLAVIAVLLTLVGAVVYVRFIRKPEVIGFDKDLVIAGVSNISDDAIFQSIDRYTLGVVASFFDQRHGPIPIIVIPDMLKDNFDTLVALSDRSFSGTGFSDDYDSEVSSSYDFVLGPKLRISVLSFGFAIEKPEARGGQENLTLNILVQRDMIELINQFKDAIQEQVHEFHMLMAKDPSNKPIIRLQANNIRKYVTAIVLSYVEIYGTTELIEEED
jgi:hypothetical protein